MIFNHPKLDVFFLFFGQNQKVIFCNPQMDLWLCEIKIIQKGFQ